MTEPFYEIDAPEDEATLFSRVAARYVQELAPAPSPIPADYYDMAAAAEYLVFNYLTQTSGASVSSEGVSGISSSYVDIGRVKQLVAPVMGTYYTGGRNTLRSGRTIRG